MWSPRFIPPKGGTTYCNTCSYISRVLFFVVTTTLSDTYVFEQFTLYPVNQTDCPRPLELARAVLPILPNFSIRSCVQRISLAMLYLGNRSHSHTAQTQRALHAADGYLYLGLPDEALGELTFVPIPEQTDPSVLLAKVRVLLHLKRWGEAEELSLMGTSHHPEEEEFTVQRAFALHQLNKGDEAVEVLL